MDTFFSDAEQAFRAEVRAFIRANLPADLAARVRAGIHLSRADMARWNAILDAKGWAAHHWPQVYGGPGWTPIQRFLFEAECADADAPPLSVFGVYLVGPTLYTFGSQAQKEAYLPGIRSGATFWCQGYSEPNAGSDLASLKTTARKVEGGYVIDGAKAWTTEGHFADYMICLARTNPQAKPQAGLSLFIIDMTAKGVSLQPVITIDGAHSVNTTFLDAVFVPDDALIGEIDKGWTYAKFLLSHERTNNAQVHRSRREFTRLKELARHMSGPAGGSVLDDPVFQRRFAALDVELSALEVTVLRVLADQTDGREPGPEASILKVIGSELQQRISELAMEVLGEEGIRQSHGEVDGEAGAAATQAAGWAERHLFRRVVTIYAGANEIQKTIIARTVLGM